eukprot:9188124-Alexandrium_andersonii.AAC.1
MCIRDRDCVFMLRGEDGEGKVYQGGHLPASDLTFLTDRNIKLVINCTSLLEQPWWVGRTGRDVPKWQRFE